MAKKRRTRKDKETAKHTFTLSWEPGAKKTPRHEVVKSQFNLGSKRDSKGKSIKENAKLSAKDGSYARIKRDIVKSLLLVSLILCLEVVIYLIRG